MKYRELVKKSSENYRKNGLITHVLFGFAILLASSLLLLCSYISWLFIFIVPLLVIPILFACMVYVIALREESVVTLRGFIAAISNFYSEKYRSTFRVMMSALIALGVYAVFLLTYGLIINLTFYYNNVMGFADFINDLLAHVNSTYEEIMIILNNNSVLLNTISIYNGMPSMFVFMIVFVFLTNINSVSLFHRLGNAELTGRASKVIQSRVLTRHFGEFVGAYLKLNWPLFVLLAGGYALGATIAYFAFGSYSTVFAFALFFAIFISFGLYGPIMLANNEAIYDCFKETYDKEFDILTKQLSQSFEEFMKALEKNKNDSNES